MVKVIQENKAYFRVICDHCKSELEYSPQDVKRSSFSEWQISRITDYIICPVCTKKSKLS